MIFLGNQSELSDSMSTIRLTDCGRSAGVLVLFVLAMGIGACGRPDPQAELDLATTEFLAGQYEDAALRLNYVVQVDPDNIRARELRGDIALLFGDYTGASAEFDRARTLGAPLDSIALKLAEAQIGHGQIQQSLDLLHSAESLLADQSLYWAIRAEAYLAAGQLQKAQSAVDAAQRAGNGEARVLTTAAQVYFSLGEHAEALELAQQALVVAPNDPRVRLAHAELLARKNRLAEAAAELHRAADLYREESLDSRETLCLLGLVQVHLARKDLGAAEVAAARLAELAPQEQWSNYFQGLVKYRRGQFDEAASLIQPLVSAAPDTIQFRSLLGAVQLARGNVGQAEQQFLRVLAVSPRDPAAAKLLAETRLRQQRPAAALDALQAVQDTAADDPQIGLLSGVATLLSGNAEQSLLYLEQAAALDPTNEILKLQLARAYLATGRDEQASKLLTEPFGEDAQAIEAKLLLLYAASRRGDAEASAGIADKLLNDYADDSRVLTAVAVHFQVNGEAARARELFERAAVLESDTATARLFVAASLVQEGRHEEAETLLRETIQQQPDNAQAIAGLAQLLAERGEVEEATGLFSRATEQTNSVVPRLAFVNMLLRQGDIDEAKIHLEKARVSAPDNAQVISLQGIIALAEERFATAVELLERAAEMLPDRLGVSLALARARLANGDVAAARALLVRTVELAPRSFPVRLALGEAELESGNTENALAVATDLKVDFPTQAGGYVLEGRAYLAMRQFDSASKSLSAAYSRKSTWPVLALKIQALRLADRSSDALDANEAWLADNPGHVPSLLMRGVLLQASGRSEEALNAYNAVLEVAPENLIALNNAAWVSFELGDSAALSMAERAHAAHPENSAVLDTIGWIHLASGNDRLAVEYLSRAADLAPGAPEIRYHLSAALVAGGQSARAREMLVALLSGGRDFAARADAERLLLSIHTEVENNP